MKRGMTLGLILSLGLLTACGGASVDDAAKATAAIGCSASTDVASMDKVASDYGFDSATDLSSAISGFSEEETSELYDLSVKYMTDGSIPECKDMMDGIDMPSPDTTPSTDTPKTE